ncbi:MAG: hypothetical protein Ct9H90mP16_09470 [Candidatus Poseidoniales archaeon]|nr:MAG: hypothetical protein Ct9H90mP16_09470 [Candidatus Poseidoniales archaeon]
MGVNLVSVDTVLGESQGFEGVVSDRWREVVASWNLFERMAGRMASTRSHTNCFTKGFTTEVSSSLEVNLPWLKSRVEKVNSRVHEPMLGSNNPSGTSWESFIDGIRRRITVGDDEWQILQFY